MDDETKSEDAAADPASTPSSAAETPAEERPASDELVTGEEATAAGVPGLGAPRLGDRVRSVDVMRGVAVLGILAMNIYAFAMPIQVYMNPLNGGGSGPLSLGVWFTTHLVFDQKFMPVFSMLFGAGLVLMAERAGGGSFAGVWYRRQFWLLVIGAVHGYLLWLGDILFTYAALGLALYPLRRRSPRFLITAGVVLLTSGLGVTALLGLHAKGQVEQARAIEQKRAEGLELTAEERRQIEAWRQMRPMMAPTPADIARDLEAYRGDYLAIVAHRAPMTFMMQTGGLMLIGIWRMGALMMIGMALMKLGVFSAARSDGFYRRLLAFGYGLGVPLVATSAWVLWSIRWDEVKMQQFGIHWNSVGGVLMALGHIAVVMLACRRGLWPGFRSRLEAVGRMALSNYLAHTVLLTPVFYGYGLGLYGHIERPAQMLIVLAVWTLQLWWSPIWLRRMRFGPAEWLWRSLTYGRLQKMRR
ncbi:MAG: DUF418 domain-containing protein [Acidobacteriota bacterium]